MRLGGRGRGGRPRWRPRPRRSAAASGDLVARGDRQQFGGRAEQTGEPVLRGEQRARAVLAAQAQGQGLVAGLGGGALAFRGGGRLAGRGEGGLGLGQRRLAASCRSASSASPASRPSTSALSASYSSCAATARSCASSRAAASRSISAWAEAARRAGGVDLAVQPGQALAAVGDGAGHVLQPPFLLAPARAPARPGARRCPPAPARPPPGPLPARPPARGSGRPRAPCPRDRGPRRSSAGADVALLTRASARRDRCRAPARRAATARTRSAGPAAAAA